MPRSSPFIALLLPVIGLGLLLSSFLLPGCDSAPCEDIYEEPGPVPPVPAGWQARPALDALDVPLAAHLAVDLETPAEEAGLSLWLGDEAVPGQLFTARDGRALRFLPDELLIPGRHYELRLQHPEGAFAQRFTTVLSAGEPLSPSVEATFPLRPSILPRVHDALFPLDWGESDPPELGSLAPLALPELTLALPWVLTADWRRGQLAIALGRGRAWGSRFAWDHSAPAARVEGQFHGRHVLAKGPVDVELAGGGSIPLGWLRLGGQLTGDAPERAALGDTWLLARVDDCEALRLAEPLLTDLVEDNCSASGTLWLEAALSAEAALIRHTSPRARQDDPSTVSLDFLPVRGAAQFDRSNLRAQLRRDRQILVPADEIEAEVLGSGSFDSARLLFAAPIPSGRYQLDVQLGAAGLTTSLEVP